MSEASMKSGAEAFRQGQKAKNLHLLKFWQWAYSDLISNTNRGVLAEYLVATALGVDRSPRREWLAYDLETPSGIKIEVKSASYLQAWFQRRPSLISYSIKQTKSWHPETNTYSSEAKRHADVYVFCLLTTRDPQFLDPLDLDQWTFHILPTAILDREVSLATDLPLAKLVSLNPVIVSYDGIAATIERVHARSTKGI